ncbi:MAG: hypothetical protein LBE62_02305 [Azonexus sp.]|jgi:hypothetical protein|nr:hypothetical protein [Azonexus sp.]
MARNTPQRAGDVLAFTVTPSVTIIQGELVLLEAGLATHTPSATAIAIGRAEQGVTAGPSGSDPVVVPVRRGIFRWDNDTAEPVTAASVGGPCYVKDSRTVTADDEAGPPLIVVAVEADGVWAFSTTFSF